MTQPKNFGFGEEETMLRDAAARYFADQLPIDRLYALVAENPDPHRERRNPWAEQQWQEIVELGWTQLAVPENAGGLGMPAVGVVGLVEEAGRAAFPGPLLMTLCATYVVSMCGSDAAATVLEGITEGQSLSLAVTNQHGSWNSADTDVVIADGRLSGTASFVQDATRVDGYVVSAQGDGGVGLFWVTADAEGVSVESDAIVDLTRDQARIKFSNVSALELAACGQGDSALDAAKPALLTLLAADMVGAAEWQLQTTVNYAGTREQFGHSLGFFQAVKHPLVDLMILIDHAKSLVYNAACALDTEPERALQLAIMAQSAACDAASYGCSRSVQYHGGIGFTWECYVHLYFKRQKHSEMWLGDGAYQREQLAALLID